MKELEKQSQDKLLNDIYDILAQNLQDNQKELDNITDMVDYVDLDRGEIIFYNSDGIEFALKLEVKS